MDDLISKTAAIDALNKRWGIGTCILGDDIADESAKVLNALPSAQPGCEDAVSRFEVLRLIDYSSHDLNDAVDNRYMQNEIKQLPSVTPKQPGWIPCSVMLPENDGVYLVTLRAITQLQKACAKIDIARFDGKWHKAYPVVAWMPLPKPWEGEKNDG